MSFLLKDKASIALTCKDESELACLESEFLDVHVQHWIMSTAFMHNWNCIPVIFTVCQEHH